MASIPPIRGNVSEHLGLVGNGNLSPPSPVVECALQDFENEFVNNVLRFTVEAEVRDYIRQRLSEHLERQVDVYGVPVVINAQYKKPYARGLAQLVETDAVHAEVNIGHSSDFESNLNNIDEASDIVDFERGNTGSGNRSLDIGVLKDLGIEHPVVDEADELAVEPQESPEEAIEVAIAAGSKYFPAGAVETAIEVKYVKDRATPGTIYESNVWKKVDSDYEKLEQINKDLDNPPESHLVIVTNYDPFRMAPHCDKTGEENKSREDGQGKSSYPEKLEDFVECAEEIGVHVWMYYPMKIYQDGTRV
jgi:hypothetical protein